MFCPFCGRQIDDKADVCLGCGRTVANVRVNAQRDSDSFGWWWLGFFFPLIGFILWCVWTGETPLRAKRAGWGALIGAITSVALVILFYAALIVLGFAAALYYEIKRLSL